MSVLTDKDNRQIEYPLHEEAKYFNAIDNLPITDILIGITYPFQNYNVKRKASYKYFLFEYILEGEGKAFIGDRWQTFKNNDIVFFNKDIDQNFHAVKGKPLKKIWISFASEYIGKMISSYNIQSGVYHNTFIKECFERVLYLSKNELNLTNFAYSFSNAIHQIITDLAFNKGEDEKREKSNLKTQLSNYIYKKISLDSIARDLGISKTTLIRRFKSEYNITPYNYLVSEKIKASKSLLKTTSMSVKEIAYLLCFTDEHYFSFMFKKITSKTPTKYKKG